MNVVDLKNGKSAATVTDVDGAHRIAFAD